MFLLAFHIVSITMLIAVVWFVAFGAGSRATERRIQRQLELDQEAEAEMAKARKKRKAK